MRMFLVVMCDMFLLLYLTALGQIDEHPVSDLTVKDYIALKRSEEDVRRVSEEREKELKELERQAQQAERRLRALQEELRDAANDRQRLSGVLSAAEKERKRAESEKTRIETEKLKAEAERAEEQRKAEDLRRETERERQLREAEKVAAEQRAEELRSQAEEMKRKAEEAERAAREAQEAAKRAQENAALADSEKAKALETAKVAKEREVTAIISAQRAAHDAADARQQAAQSSETAVRAEQEKAKMSERVKAITQRAEVAYQKNVASKLLSVNSVVETNNLLIGKTERRYQLEGVAVALSGRNVIVVPSEQIGLEAGRDPNEYARLSFSVDGKPVRQIFVPQGHARVLALVVEGPVDSVQAVAEDLPLTGLMPTLIAIRNGSQMGFRDRIRGIDAERFVFQRDRLQQRAGVLSYEAVGFRGTGDFGERIIQGDQIVDLDGNFIGLAAKDGEIVRISSLRKWRGVLLSGRPAAEVVGQILR